MMHINESLCLHLDGDEEKSGWDFLLESFKGDTCGEF